MASAAFDKSRASFTPAAPPAPPPSSPGTRGFSTYDLEDAPPEARPFLEASLRQVGFIPVAVGRWAASPTLMKAFFHSLALFERTSLSPLERETVIMAVARENDCRLCQALHTAELLDKASRATVMALREGRPTGDRRLDALTAFTHSLLAGKGDPAIDAWRAFLAAGFERAQALDVVLLAATTTLSTMTNRLVEAPLDPQLAAFAPGQSL
jgi:AhpD family alkylhydroperoxidase